jgi:hypothetical protein
VSDTGFARIGTWGAVLTLAILLASALLRLACVVEDGEARSLLPGTVETVARIAHRISAMGIAILAAWALVAVVRERPAPRPRVLAVAAILVLTLVLALIGRYTPGYRLMAVTVVNVAAGTALACAFWWLRELAAPRRFAPLAVIALALILAQAALGAAASAAAMWGGRAFGPLHVWVAMMFVIVATGAVWQQRARRALGAAVLSLTVAQVVLGAYLVATRPPALALAHAAIAAVLAMLLVRLAAKKGSDYF